MGGVSSNDDCPLDREWWSNLRCDQCKKRKAQLTVDETPDDKRQGKYHHFCWQCYWFMHNWRLGPIVNCGPAWDMVDVRRSVNRALPESSPS